ncbi:hypothetical protein RB195_008987 [Necator americanus]|uniref:Uncharacterized protein n=1 Tax=Necator americanus TaxID=51031 RepID=A0ABR1CTT7_NECAM
MLSIRVVVQQQKISVSLSSPTVSEPLAAPFALFIPQILNLPYNLGVKDDKQGLGQNKIGSRHEGEKFKNSFDHTHNKRSVLADMM